MGMKLLRAIINKTKKHMIRNTNIRSELGVDKIKNGIQKSKLKWFGPVIQMAEERIPKKMLHTKMEGK